MATDLRGRVALVVGASRGIGAATAAAFGRAGADVVLAARDVDALELVASGIRETGGRALAVPADVTDAESVRALVAQAVSSFGGLDIAFNNANDTPGPTPLAEIEVSDFDRGIATSMRGTFVAMKYEIPAMLDRGGGAIVNMASQAGVNGVANLAPYVAGKAGVIGLTKVAALDYADYGIRVNVLAPGPILTHNLEAAGPEVIRLAGTAVPMGRVGTVDEVARAVLWLCSPDASFITGVVLPVDGGQLAGNKPPQMFRPGQTQSR